MVHTSGRTVQQTQGTGEVAEAEELTIGTSAVVMEEAWSSTSTGVKEEASVDQGVLPEEVINKQEASIEEDEFLKSNITRTTTPLKIIVITVLLGPSRVAIIMIGIAIPTRFTTMPNTREVIYILDSDNQQWTMRPSWPLSCPK